MYNPLSPPIIDYPNNMRDMYKTRSSSLRNIVNYPLIPSF